MADEATLNVSLSIQVGNIDYQSLPSSFTADVSSAGGYGPTPGGVLATLAGTSISLSGLTSLGGFVRVQNLDPTNFIEFGMYDPDTSKFYSFMDVLPGESFVFRISRNYKNEFGAGTGTTGSNVEYRVRVDPAQTTGTTAWALVEAFNR